MDDHNAAVAAIAADVRQFHQRQQPFRIYHGSTNSTRESPYGRDNIVNTSHLHHVLQVNTDKKTVLVEPNVSMDQLVAATFPQGLVPLVVMEFPGITAGGGFSGTSGESSSFRHGFFDATVTRIEIVLANGDVRTASPTDADADADLFWGVASALGTLGVVTMLEIQCRPAKPYVALTYLSASSMAQAMQLVRDATADPATEYLDGIVCAHDHIVICAGRLADLPPATAADPQPYRVQRFSRPHDPWFYLHAQRRAGRDSEVDYVPIEDYLFRYDRGAFWTGRYAFRYFVTPFNRITRYVLDRFMHTRVMYRALHASGLAHQFVIQDVAVPYAATTEFLDWLRRGTNFNAYPIWLCPLRLTQSQGGLMLGRAAPGAEDDQRQPSGDEYLMNFGLWAPSPFRRKSPEFVAQNRRLEQKVHELGGKKWLYAHAYYTEDEFWAVYDKRRYDRLRERFHAAYLPDLYHKVRVNLAPENRGWTGMLWDVWPLRGLYGVSKACRGGDYLLRKQS